MYQVSSLKDKSKSKKFNKPEEEQEQQDNGHDKSRGSNLISNSSRTNNASHIYPNPYRCFLNNGTETSSVLLLPSYTTIVYIVQNEIDIKLMVLGGQIDINMFNDARGCSYMT